VIGGRDGPAARAQTLRDLLVDRAAVVGKKRVGMALAHDLLKRCVLPDGGERPHFFAQRCISPRSQPRRPQLSKFQFAISSGPESIRQAGVVESDSFDDAVVLLGKKIVIQAGDSLEIGVSGFPPARYQCIGAVKNGRPVWIPDGQMAA